MAPGLKFIGVIILCMAYSVSAQCPSAICDCSNYASRKEIRCGSRDLSSIPNIPPDTQVLRLEFNRITSISSTDLSGLVNLKRLTLYNNMIEFIDPRAFVDQQNLEELNLKNNKISYLHNQTFQTTQNLMKLSLDNNLLQFLGNDIFQGLVKLNELEIDGNPLQSLPDGIFRDLSNLRFLDISNVAFQSLPVNLFDGLTNLGTLKMNNVTQNGDDLFSSDFLFDSVANLTTLEIRQNSLRCIPVSLAAFRKLEVLKLSMNPLTCNNFTGLKHLQHLEQLHMDDTGLTRLTSNMFEGNTNLFFLLIEYSSLATVEEGALNGLGQLEELYLGYNNLSTLPYNVFDPLPSNVNLELYHNPWNCDCNLRWLQTWLTTSYTGVIPDDHQPVCSSPDRLLNQRIIDIDDNDYACMPESELNDTMTHSVNEGENFVLGCAITGDPSPALYWLTPDHTELLPNTNQIPFSVDAECTLTIIRITKEDAGTYSCTGTNAAGSLSVRNVVNVIENGNGPVFTTSSHLQSTTATTPQMAPQTGTNSSLVVVVGAVVGFLVLLVVVIVLVVIFRRRSQRKNRIPPGLDRVVFRDINATLPGPPSCNDLPSNMVSPAGDDRYADTMQRDQPFGPPPPYSTIPPPPSDGIYQEIANDDGLYERPRGPGDMSPASVRLDHTYMAQMQRQDSCVSNGSCGAPSGYERSMIREVCKPRSHASSTCDSPTDSGLAAKGAQNNVYVDMKNQKVALQKQQEDDDQRVRVPRLNPDAKVTYENTKRT